MCVRVCVRACTHTHARAHTHPQVKATTTDRDHPRSTRKPPAEDGSQLFLPPALRRRTDSRHAAAPRRAGLGSPSRTVCSPCLPPAPRFGRRCRELGVTVRSDGSVTSLCPGTAVLLAKTTSSPVSPVPPPALRLASHPACAPAASAPLARWEPRAPSWAGRWLGGSSSRGLLPHRPPPCSGGPKSSDLSQTVTHSLRGPWLGLRLAWSLGWPCHTCRHRKPVPPRSGPWVEQVS